MKENNYYNFLATVFAKNSVLEASKFCVVAMFVALDL
jgi:hypothetical protein